MVNIWYIEACSDFLTIIRNYNCMGWKALDSFENQAGKECYFNWIVFWGTFLISAVDQSPSLRMKLQICTVKSCCQEHSPVAGIDWNGGKSLPLLFHKHLWYLAGSYSWQSRWPLWDGIKMRKFFVNTLLIIYLQKVDVYTCILMSLVLCIIDRYL